MGHMRTNEGEIVWKKLWFAIYYRDSGPWIEECDKLKMDSKDTDIIQ